MGVQTMFWAISLCQTSGPDRHLAGNECFVAKILMMGKDFKLSEGHRKQKAPELSGARSIESMASEISLSNLNPNPTLITISLLLCSR